MSAPKTITEANGKDTAPTYELLAFPPPERPTVDGLLEASSWLLDAGSDGVSATRADETGGSGADILLHDARVLVEAARDLAETGRAPTFIRVDGPPEWIKHLAEGLRDALHDSASYELPYGLLALVDAIVDEVCKLQRPAVRKALEAALDEEAAA